MTGRKKAVMKKSKLSTALLFLAVAAVLSLLIPGCDDFSFYTRLDGAGGLRITTPGGLPSGTLTIIPEDAVLPVDTSYTFSATGGISPYSFFLVSGTGSIDELTGLYTAPSDPGEAVVSVIDSTGFAVEASIAILSVGEFTIAPTSVSLYIYNTTTFTVFGGVGPYSWAVISGAGIIDSGSGAYTAPDSPGNDVVRVTDSLGNFSEASINILSPFSLNPSEILITVGNSYTFTAEGGATPYVFTIASGSGTVNPDTGEYTAPGTAGSAVVGATDSLGNFDSAEVTIVPDAALLISPASLTLNVGGTANFSATGGTSPYEFTILSGDGTIGLDTGIYDAWSSAGTDIVRLTDDLGATRDAVVTIVSAGPLSINPPAAVVEQDDVFDFYADGGSPPYTYSVSSGAGFVNSSSGLYTAPSATGSATVRVTDSLGAWSESAIDIAPAAPTDLATDDSDLSPNAITLSWTDNATGEDGFIIERKPGGGAFAVLETVGSDIVTYLDDGSGGLPVPSPNNIYGYRLKAYSAAVESDYSNEAYDIPNP